MFRKWDRFAKTLLIVSGCGSVKQESHLELERDVVTLVEGSGRSWMSEFDELEDAEATNSKEISC
jgi:hypothetical protein